jgi:ACS family tartrate transporter-like MFS transporter
LVSPTIESVTKKVSGRLIWFLVLLYFLAILDRGAAGFAAVTMNRDVGLTAEAFGIGTGLFFVGYLSAEIPANVLLQRLGARFWLSRIIFTWGLVAMLMALVVGPLSFYAARFLLGVAEAGFFPGVIYYMTLWFPKRERAKYNALFMIAIPIAIATAAPISTSILLLDGQFGLTGWQWVFLSEGLPSVAAGIASWFYLTDRPESASWLTAEEKRVLSGVLLAEKQEQEKLRSRTIAESLRDPTVLALGLVYGGINVSLVMAANWLPQIVKGFVQSNSLVGLLVSLPFLAGAIAMIVWGKRSDRAAERIMHTAAALLLCGAGWIGAGLVNAPVAVMSCVVVAVVGLYAAMGVFWTLPAAYLAGAGAASGIALVSAMGHLSSALSPVVVGRLRDQTGTFSSALIFVGVATLASALILPLIGRAFKRPAAAALQVPAG